MLEFSHAIIVEGKYDKAKLARIVKSLVISTDGFDIYKNAPKRELIKQLAEKDGIIILTDSDSAGKRIRNYIKNFCGKNGKVVNLYIPEIAGKERRKEDASKEGKLGVEGMEEEVLKRILESVDENITHCTKSNTPYDINNFYELGYIGQPNSKEKRRELCKKHGLPQNLSTKQFVEIFKTCINFKLMLLF